MGNKYSVGFLKPLPSFPFTRWGRQPSALEEERVWVIGLYDNSLHFLPACSRSMANKEGGPSQWQQLQRQRRQWWQQETNGNLHRY